MTTKNKFKGLKIFLCEDDENLGEILKELLEAKDFDVDLYTDGDKGWRFFPSNTYDLCLLDVMMPKKDGFTLARDIRKINAEIPIIFLTAMGMRENKVEGFSVGADDYITKPFSTEELILRIEALLRRTRKWKVEEENIKSYSIGRFIYDTVGQTITGDGEPQKLTTKESELLTLLCQHVNDTLERGFALRKIWGIDPAKTKTNDKKDFSQRSLDVYITRLRRMLKGDPSVEIKNVHGKGYKLVIPNYDMPASEHTEA